MVKKWSCDLETLGHRKAKEWEVYSLKKNIFLICILIFLLSGCNSGDSINNENINNGIKMVKDISDDSTYSIDLIREDMEYFKDSYLGLHQELRKTKVRKDFLDKYDRLYNSIDSPITKKELFFRLSQLTVPLEDGHAIIENPDESYFLPLEFRWTEEGIYVVKSNIELVEVGDKIIEITHNDMEELLNKLKTIISTENDYWVKARGSEMLRMQYILAYLNCINSDNSVELEIQKPDGSIINQNINLVSGLKGFMGSAIPLDSYYKGLKDYNAAILTIPSCSNTSGYKNTLDDFFNYVHENNISRIIIDLRDNIGGDSRVLDEFLKYIDIESLDYFYEYNTVIKNRGVKVEHIKGELYNGDIYIATSNKTFSSAVLFAGVIKYNHIGLTIGEPTGNATIRYGYSNRFELPNTELGYIVASHKWALPNVGYQKTIMPDILLPYKIEHILNEVDPIEEWIKSGV